MDTEKEFSGKTVSPANGGSSSACESFASGEKVRRYVDILSDAGFKAAAMFAHRHPEAANAPDATRYETKEEQTEEGWLIIPFSAPFTDFYVEPEVGESYVIWAFQENYGGSVSPEDIITIVYDYGLNVDAAFSEITFKDATVTVTPAEGTSYFYGISETFRDRNSDYGNLLFRQEIGFRDPLVF